MLVLIERILIAVLFGSGKDKDPHVRSESFAKRYIVCHSTSDGFQRME